MTDPDLERMLTEAFDLQARQQVSDGASPPVPRFAASAPELGHPVSRTPAGHHRFRRLAPLLAAAAVVAAVVGSFAAAGSFSATPKPPAVPAGTPVYVRADPLPSGRVGVGMPVVAYFSQRFADARDWQRATTVTADGHRLAAAWYFVRSKAVPGYPIAGHLRPQHFWPGQSTISIHVDARRLPAGSGFVFADGLRATFRTGPAQVATVDDRSHELTLARGGKVIDRCAVSLGRPGQRTSRGIKVVMAKSADRRLTGPGYSIAHVHDVQQLTTTGEYLLAAPWIEWAINTHRDMSGGSTSLRPADARLLFRTMRVGDVVRYPDASGPRMQLADGYGDWNVPWRTWLTGGAIPTR